jgi:hypothetical protein
MQSWMLSSSCCWAARCYLDAEVASGRRDADEDVQKARANAGQVNTMSGVSRSYFCRSPDSCFRFGVYAVKLTEKGQLDPNEAFLLRGRSSRKQEGAPQRTQNSTTTDGNRGRRTCFQ